MNESITRAAGAVHGQELPPAAMRALIRGAGRVPRQRTTLYGAAPPEQEARALAPPPLVPLGSPLGAAGLVPSGGVPDAIVRERL